MQQQGFNDRLGIDGIIMTKLDGDSREEQHFQRKG